MVDRKESKEETPSDKRPPAPPIVRLGELLIKEGLLKEKDIEDALSVQRQEAAMSTHPLGEILVEFGMLAKSDLEHLLNHPSLRQHIGSLAVERGFLNKHQLEECLKKQAPDQLLGNVLIKEGFLTPEDLQKLLKEQMDTPRFGEIAVKLRLISDKNLQKALRIQKAPRMLGEILCEEGVIHPVDLYYVLNKHKKQSRVGEILVKLGYLENTALNAALKEQKNSSESLGELLIRKKLITPQQLQDALSQQASLPFRSLEGFAYSEEDKKALGALISQRYAEKNLMIPLSLENKDLTIGLVRPEDIHNARELKDLYKNIHISCVLIKQEKFNELFDILYSKKLGVPRSRETVSGDSSGKVVEFMEIELNEDLGMENREVPGTAEQDIEAEELLNFIIKYGISNKASDIHLEQDREGVKLRYRIDGVLQDVKKG